MPQTTLPQNLAERRLTRGVRAALLGLALTAGHATLAVAADPATALEASAPRTYAIPAGPLGRTLAAFAVDSRLALSFDPALTEGLSSAGLSGPYTPRDAAAELLRGSGLEIVARSDGSYTLRRLQAAAAAPGLPAAVSTTLPPVRVVAATDPNQPPARYAGGKVARGARFGMAGNTDYMNAPVSVVAFTSEFRDDTQALSVSDMLKYSVSAQTPQAGAVPTTDVIYVRGFDIGSYDGTLDGLPGLLGRMPPVEAVERVELLLGANTFANGQPGAVGGSINIVPKRADDVPLTRVSVGYRSKSILGTTVDVGRRFGPDNALGVRVNLGYSDGDTELKNGERRTFSRALALDLSTSNTRFTFDYMGNDRRLPAEAWFFVRDGFQVPDVNRASRDFRQPWTFYKDNWDVVMARAEWDFAPKWTLSAAAGRMWNKVERFSQVNEVIDNDGNTVDAYGGSLGHSRHKRIGNAHEVLVRGGFDTGPLKHRASAGFAAYGEKNAYEGAGPAATVVLDSNIYNPVHYPRPVFDAPQWRSTYDPRTRNSSLFVSDQITALNDRLHVTIGARRVEFDANDGNPVISKWSPGLGVLFKLQPSLSIYANRLEGLDPGYLVQPPATNAGTMLPPLPADQTELGLKGDFGKVGFTAAVFEIERPSYYLDAVTGVEGANGRQVNRGLELSLFGEVTRGLRLYSSATVIDPKRKKTDGGTYDGKVAVSAGRFMANAHADWDIPNVTGLALLAGFSHSGKVFNDDANTQPLKAWTRFDAGLRYRTKILGRSTTARLNIDNVADKRYWVSERGTIYMAPARSVGLSLTTDL